MLAWVMNLDFAASGVGAATTTGGMRSGLLLVGIGKCLTFLLHF
jgi:hypothetical protein